MKKLQIGERFYSLEKVGTLHRVDSETQEVTTEIGEFSPKSARNFILNELFDVEFDPEDHKKIEKLLGFSKSELCAMDFEVLLIAVHKYYQYSIQYNTVEYVPGADYYALRDYE